MGYKMGQREPFTILRRICKTHAALCSLQYVWLYTITFLALKILQAQNNGVSLDAFFCLSASGNVIYSTTEGSPEIQAWIKFNLGNEASCKEIKSWIYTQMYVNFSFHPELCSCGKAYTWPSNLWCTRSDKIEHLCWIIPWYWIADY